VLDGMEHVLEGAGLLSALLKEAPGLRALVTSRERLALREEWVYPLEGLDYPAATPLPDEGERLLVYSAVELFYRRAAQAGQRFALEAATAPAVAHICRLAEGLPLAVELAASWATTHSCQEIARALEQNLDILTTMLRQIPERQRSVRAAFEYSWQMLAGPERDAFARLSIFRGGFGAEAAFQVSGAAPPTLLALLEKSLLRRDPAGRYAMHELLRQYAEEKLHAEPAAREETRSRYVRHMASFLARQGEHLNDRQQKGALEEIGREIENVHHAWNLAVASGDALAIADSLDSVYRFCDVRGRFQEGIDLIAQAIARWENDPWQQALTSRMLARQGMLYQQLGQHLQSRPLLERALALLEQQEASVERVFVLVGLANAARKEGKSEETARLAGQALALARQIGDRRGAARALFLLSTLRYSSGEMDKAETLLEESLALAHASGDPQLVRMALNALGDVYGHRGDSVRAQRAFEECLSLSRELGDLFNVAMHLNNLGTVLHQQGQYAGARSLYQESLEICRRIGDVAGQAVALSNLGEIALILGDRAAAWRYYQQGLEIGRAFQDQWILMVCLNNLGEIAGLGGDDGAALRYLTEALWVAVESQEASMASKVLLNLAAPYARQGRPALAAELLAAVRSHDASEQEGKEKAGRLAQELDLSLPDSPPRPLEAVVAEVMALSAGREVEGGQQA